MSLHLYEKHVNNAIWELLQAVDQERYAKNSMERADRARDLNDVGYYLTKAESHLQEAEQHRERAGRAYLQAALVARTLPLEEEL